MECQHTPVGATAPTSSSLVNSSEMRQVLQYLQHLFFVISEALTSDLYKPSFAKGGFGWNVNISPVGATAPTSSSLVNSSKESPKSDSFFVYNHIITSICAYPISINSLLPTIPFTAVFLHSVSKTG